MVRQGTEEIPSPQPLGAPGQQAPRTNSQRRPGETGEATCQRLSASCPTGPSLLEHWEEVILRTTLKNKMTAQRALQQMHGSSRDTQPNSTPNYAEAFGEMPKQAKTCPDTGAAYQGGEGGRNNTPIIYKARSLSTQGKPENQTTRTNQ